MGHFCFPHPATDCCSCGGKKCKKDARAVKVDARLNKGFEVGAVCRAQLGGVQGDVVHGGLQGGVQ